MNKKNFKVLPPSAAGDAFCEADRAIRDYTRKHKAPLTAEEHKELGALLQERAKRMSELLGVHVSSIAD